MDGRNRWYNAYSSMLRNQYSSALETIRRTQLRDTNMSALRKIHETVATVCDRITAADIDRDKSVLESVLADVAKAAVIVKYQRDRGYIDRFFAEALLNILVNDILRRLEQVAAGRGSGENVKKYVSTLRLFLDAVIAYHYLAIKKRP